MTIDDKIHLHNVLKIIIDIHTVSHIFTADFMNFNCQVGRWRRSALACTVALWRHQRCPSRAAGHAVVTEVETVEVGMGREEEFL